MNNHESLNKWDGDTSNASAYYELRRQGFSHDEAIAEIEANDKEPIVCLVCIEQNLHDEWGEDDEGRETHSLQGDKIVRIHEVKLSKLQDWVTSYMESNAENPPYDSCDIKFGFWKEDNVFIPRDTLLR